MADVAHDVNRPLVLHNSLTVRKLPLPECPFPLLRLYGRMNQPALLDCCPTCVESGYLYIANTAVARRKSETVGFCHHLKSGPSAPKKFPLFSVRFIAQKTAFCPIIGICLTVGRTTLSDGLLGTHAPDALKMRWYLRTTPRDPIVKM